MLHCNAGKVRLNCSNQLPNRSAYIDYVGEGLLKASAQLEDIPQASGSLAQCADCLLYHNPTLCQALNDLQAAADASPLVIMDMLCQSWMRCRQALSCILVSQGSGSANCKTILADPAKAHAGRSKPETWKPVQKLIKEGPWGLV